MEMNQPTGRANGFTLVEIMIATMILTVGLLAMAASTGYISTNLRSSKFDTQRQHEKEMVIEKLRGSVYNTLAAGSQTVDKFSFTWTVSAPNINSTRVQLITSGPGVRLGRGSKTTVVDTLYFDIMSP